MELLITISIIALLSSAFLIVADPANQQKKTKDADKKSDLRTIQAALELYRADCGDYPAETTSPAHNVPSPLTSNCSGTTVTYLQSVPTQPNSSASYYYDLYPTGGYGMSVCIDNASDPEGVVNANCSSGKAFSVFSP